LDSICISGQRYSGYEAADAMQVTVGATQCVAILLSRAAIAMHAGLSMAAHYPMGAVDRSWAV